MELRELPPPSTPEFVAALGDDRYLRIAVLDRAIALATRYPDKEIGIVATAKEFYAFLAKEEKIAAQPTSPAQAAVESLGKPRGRGKSAKTDAPAPAAAPASTPEGAAGSPSDPPASAATAVTAASSAPAGTDIFGGSGAPSAPAVTPTPPTASAAAPSAQSSKEKDLTVEDVREALVQVQTKFESRAAAQKILGKFAPNTGTTGELKKDQFAAVIKECQDAIAAAGK